MTTTSNYPSPEVLVAIMNNQRDWEIARTQHWYRIPVNSANRFIPDLEQMQYLAFYQTQNFDRDGCAVNYYAGIEQISTTRRIELLPDEAGNQNAEALYYKLEIAPFVTAYSEQTTAHHFHYDDTSEIQCSAGD